MGFSEELLLDFSMHIARVFVNDRQGIIDNVKQIMYLSDQSIVVSCGTQLISIRGQQLSISFLDGERMYLQGIIDAVEFFRERKPHE